MGNCITRKAILAENRKNEPAREAKTSHMTSTGLSSAIRTAKSVENKKEKTARFTFHQEDANIAEESCRETNSGVVRIRLVLTQNELNQILNGELKQSSADQLLNIIKSRSKRVCPDGSIGADRNANWRPALDSIPEDQ